jgi:hypothetical protein
MDYKRNQTVLAPWDLLDSIYYKETEKPKEETKRYALPVRIDSHMKNFNPDIATDLAKEFYYIQSNNIKKFEAQRLYRWSNAKWINAKVDYLTACGVTCEIEIILPKVTKVGHIILSQKQKDTLSKEALFIYDLIHNKISSPDMAKIYGFNSKRQTKARNEIRKAYALVPT